MDNLQLTRLLLGRPNAQWLRFASLGEPGCSRRSSAPSPMRSDDDNGTGKDIRIGAGSIDAIEVLGYKHQKWRRRA